MDSGRNMCNFIDVVLAMDIKTERMKLEEFSRYVIIEQDLKLYSGVPKKINLRDGGFNCKIYALQLLPQKKKKKKN